MSNEANVDLLTHVKEYLRIDGSREDDMLNLLIKSAQRYMKNAGVEKKDDEIYILAIMMLVTHWYENREQVTNSVPQAISLGLQSIILQLKSW